MSSYQKLDETQHVKNNIFLLFAQFFTLPCLSLSLAPPEESERNAFGAVCLSVCPSRNVT